MGQSKLIQYSQQLASLLLCGAGSGGSFPFTADFFYTLALLKLLEYFGNLGRTKFASFHKYKFKDFLSTFKLYYFWGSLPPRF